MPSDESTDTDMANRVVLLILILLISIPRTFFPAEMVILATGDIMPAEKALPFIERHGHSYPYGATERLFKKADIVFGNLETPLTEGGKRYENKKFTFKAPIETAGALREAGFTHLSLANNHMMDYGMEGLRSTIAALDEAGIEHAGAGMNLQEARTPAVVTVRGTTVALLAYSNTFPKEFYAGREKGGTAPGYAAFVRRDVGKAAGRWDVVIVSFHWGGELLDRPKDYQRDLAHAAIDGGARIVLGHHPHVLQGVEFYRDGVIFYSLGNYVFGSYSPSARDSIIARIVMEGERISRVEAVPINVNNFEVHFRPVILKGAEGAAVIAGLSDISEALGSAVLYAGDVGIVRKATKVTMKKEGPSLSPIRNHHRSTSPILFLPKR